MATYIQRGQAVIDAAIDGTSTTAQQQRVANRAIEYRPDILAAIAVDPENPTNEEKAEVFIRALREWGQSWLRRTAEDEEEATNDAAVTAAGDTSASDF